MRPTLVAGVALACLFPARAPAFARAVEVRNGASGSIACWST